MPWPHVASSLIAGAQMVCGGLLLVGLLGRAAAAVMLAGFIAAVLYAADVHGLGDLLALDQTARIALCCWLVAAGSGEWSIDAWAARYRSRRVRV